MIEIPEGLMITAGKVAEMEKYSRILDTYQLFPTPFELLTLFFCLEESHISDYGPYLKILPKSFTTPSYLGEVIDANDLPLSSRNFWVTQENDLKEIWNKIHNAISYITYEKFLWAWHIVNTRCIYVENKAHPKIDNSQGDTLAVVPFIDMLNHNPHAQGLAIHDRFSSMYVLKATRFVTEGSQIYVCYGPHDNARLWMEYGFTMDNNPNGRVVITHELLIALTRKVGVKFTDEHETAVKSAGLPCNLYLSDEGPSWGLRSNLRILMMKTDEIQRWREVIYAEKTCLDDSSQSEEDKLLVLVMNELKMNVISKMSKVLPKLSWIWEEQLNIINSVLSSLS